MRAVPDKPSLEGLEAKWRARWDQEGTYRFDRSKTRDEVFSIDTPPPTVSGRLHIGHVFSYTHTDLVARYQRMRGKEVFYPMGWDDNGLNVERRVQLMTGTIVDPTLPYEPDLTNQLIADGVLPSRRQDAGHGDAAGASQAAREAPASSRSGAKGRKPEAKPVSRPNFVELCEQVVPLLEADYHELWASVGLSVDWEQTYTTIGPKATRASQRGLLRLYHRGLAFRAEAPTLWDVDMKTAVAQAELADREVPSAYHRLRFVRPDGEPLLIDTTRPELLPACVAVVAHPDDERYRPLLGQKVTTPLFGVDVPVVAHELADPEKGTGVAMVCTFGDTTDVVWWRELDLDLRTIVQRDGTLAAQPPDGVDAAAYGELAGKGTAQARRRVVELLTDGGHTEGEPRPITHAVKFWENGTRPLEIVTSRQWFIRFPPTEELLARGTELAWWPEFMRVRYENWVNGLIGDWNITRQRYFGVPFPAWYPIGADGEVDWLAPILADEADLPVDPTTVTPPGYDEAQRNQPGGFAADPDVMDTWATSSLTAQIVCGWEDDPDLWARTFPMDMRPQAHEIIRTWLFTSVVRSHYEHGRLPWANAAISGFIVDPDRKKLGKSSGNAPDDPMALLERHGADAIRYWAANGRPGMDMAFDEGQMKIGRRLAIKLLNASKFALNFVPEGVDPSSGDRRQDAGHANAADPVASGEGSARDEPQRSEGQDARSGAISAVSNPLDRSMLAGLAHLVTEATDAFERFDYARALERTEAWFWTFCDDYLELVKGRAYAEDTSAAAALGTALDTVLRLLAPFLPYATEEVWSWWREGSIHRAAWPAPPATDRAADPDVLSVVASTLGAIRRAKTEAKQSMRADVAKVVVRGSSAMLDRLRAAADDVKAAGRVAELELVEAAEPAVEVTLAG